jgi:Transposase DDE domain group 1
LNGEVIRLDFDRRLMLQFRGSIVTSDAGLLPYRELDDVLGLTAVASDVLADRRIGKNGRHALAGWFRQSIFGRLAGYEDVNDAERLGSLDLPGCQAAASRKLRTRSWFALTPWYCRSTSSFTSAGRFFWSAAS